MTERRVSHYEIESALGEGGMGKVYRARDLNLDRPVALKFLGARLTDPTFKERFRREARLAAQLNHPHIATIYEFGEEGDEAFIAMELVEGETLEEKIKRSPLSLTQARQWGTQAASALAAAHALGIVHRDIKPANLMITRDGRLKVMDFGVARRTGDTALTMEGGLVGTANIIAPETLMGQPPTPKSDLFSLGCVLYEALAGRSPFPGEDVMAILYQVRNEEPRPLREHRPDVPEDLAALIHGMLVKDPEARVGPAELVAARLSGEAPTGDGGGTMVLSAPGALLEGTARGTQIIPGTTGTVVAAPPRRAGTRRVAFALIGGVAVLALGFLGAEMWKRPAPKGPPAPVDDPRAVAMNDQGARLWQSHADNADSLDRAEQLFFEATELDPDYAVPWNNLANLRRARGKLDAAETWLREAVGKRPDYVIALTNLALVLEDQSALLRGGGKTVEADQKIAEAKSLYLRAIDTDTTSVYPRNNLGYLYVTTGETDKALPVLSEAIKRFPGEAALYKNRGLAYLAQEVPVLASKDFMKAAELDPAYLGRIAQAAEKTDVALARELWKALGTRPEMRAQADAALLRLGTG